MTGIVMAYMRAGMDSWQPCSVPATANAATGKILDFKNLQDETRKLEYFRTIGKYRQFHLISVLKV